MEVGSRRSWPPPRNGGKPAVVATAAQSPTGKVQGRAPHHIRGKPHPSYSREAPPMTEYLLHGKKTKTLIPIHYEPNRCWRTLKQERRHSRLLVQNWHCRVQGEAVGVRRPEEASELLRFWEDWKVDQSVYQSLIDIIGLEIGGSRPSSLGGEGPGIYIYK